MTSTQKVAIITGASQGVGAGLVKGFREIGYAVVVNSPYLDARDFSGDPAVAASPGDIADPETAECIAEAAMERFGRVDTLVNNAGIFISKPFVGYTEADFADVIAVNLAGFFHMSQRAASRMLQAGAGHIVTITAALAEQPMTVVPAALTSLTKAGLDAVTRALATEYAGRGVRVNAVSPGVINTPMHPPEAHEFLAGLQPLGRIGGNPRGCRWRVVS